MNQRYVLTTVKLKDLLSLFVISLHKVQTQNLLFTFTWNVKRAQNNFVPIFNSKVRVRLIHECDLYSSKYGRLARKSLIDTVERTGLSDLKNESVVVRASCIIDPVR